MCNLKVNCRNIENWKFLQQMIVPSVSSAKKKLISIWSKSERITDDPLGLKRFWPASNPYVEAYRWWLGGGIDLTWRIVAVGLRHLLRDDGDSCQGVRLIFFHLLDPA